MTLTSHQQADNNNAMVATESNELNLAMNNQNTVNVPVFSEADDRYVLSVDPIGSDFGTESENSDNDAEPIPLDFVDKSKDKSDGKGADELQPTTSKQIDIQQLLTNDQIKILLDQMVDKKLKERELENGKGTTTTPIEGRNSAKKNKGSNTNGDFVKSPLDTTIYVLAFTKIINTPPENAILDSKDTADNTVDKISALIQSVRVSGQKRPSKGSVDNDNGPVLETGEVTTSRRESIIRTKDYEDAKARAEKAIIEAEKYKAMIAELQTGEEISGVNVQNAVGLTDDDFFHLTCHVDASLIAKIEKGEFVELEKLLPKDKQCKSDDNRLEWIQSDGGTFLAPVGDQLKKITNFRKWEHAFRVYATIYCGANPHRSKEIWQYISVISTAASTFVWDNVYEYNVTFCHLMAFNPSRSWAVTYNQMWNLCMKDTLPNRGNNQIFTSKIWSRDGFWW